jgi:hypothetical protein
LTEEATARVASSVPGCREVTRRRVRSRFAPRCGCHACRSRRS